MIAYRDNDMNDARVTDAQAWRAQFFADRAQQLEDKAQKLLHEAEQCRQLARKLNPTSA